MRILAWVPLAICIGLGVYLAISADGAPVTEVFRVAIEAALHGHVSALIIGVVLAAFAQIGIAVPFVLHMAENPAIVRKGGWIVGGVLVASIVLPIYAHRHLRPAR